MDRTSRTTTATPERVAGDGHRGGVPFRVEPGKRRVEVPQLVVAVLVIAVSALVAVVAFSGASARQPVLALAANVARGDVMSSGDLRVVYVATDDPVATMQADTAASLVGLVAVTDLAADTLVTPGFFVERSVVATGEGVVGLALSPGEYPTGQLAPGDRVDVISSAAPPVDGAVMVAGAEVFDVAELGTQGDRFVSLRMPASDAARVATAAEAGAVRLVLVAGVGS